MLEPGTLVAGKLRIEKVLGRGGMGEVVVATHVGLDQRVAIKILHPDLANQPEVVARFVREARASAKLRCDNVCRVTDVGELEGGQPYIEMELLEGQDLASRIAQAPLSIEVASDYIAQACIAIAEAHHLGIIHRDLKPANLFVTQRIDGSALIKVLDFGIATAPSSEDFKITKTTTVMGSPGYMSPEHLRSARDVDVRSDIWALGVILYEAVTGRLPFFAQSITELAVKVVMDEPEPLTRVDPRFAAIVTRCLQKSPEQRFQTVAELAAELATFGGQTAHTSAMLAAKLLGGASTSRSQPAAPVSAATAAAAGFAPTMATSPPGAASAVQLASAPAVATAPPPSSPPPPSTTLGSAASASLAGTPAPKRRKGLVIAGLAVVVLAGAAGAFALVGRSGEHGAHAPAPKHHEGGPPQVVAAVTSLDAAVAIAPPAADPQMRAKLEELAQNKDYQGILVFADVDQNDPQVAAIVGDAKKKYVAQQTKEIAEHVQHGDCATAKVEAGEGAKLVPDARAAFDTAAVCAAKPAPPTQATTSATPATADQAADEYEKGEYGKALATAEQVLKKAPKDASALGVAARAACGMKDAAKAKAYYGELPARERTPIVQVCERTGVDILAGTHVETVSDAQADVRAATRAISAHDWTTAESSAKRALKGEPNNREAQRALGLAACRLHHQDVLDDVLAHAPMRVAAMIRRSCNRED